MTTEIKKPEITIAGLLKKIRQETPLSDNSLNIKRGTEIRQGYLNRIPVKRAVITLKSTGCEWVRISGGCSLCGHYICTSQGEKIEEESYLTDFLDHYKLFDFKDIPLLCLYNSGSILNYSEIPKEVLLKICRILSANKNLKKVVFETRLDYCNKDYILELKKILGPISLELATGLETRNETIRNLILNKGVLDKDYENFSKKFKGIVDFRFYIIVKPPFLTESEAIEDACAAIHYAYNLGAKEVHLEPATIQKYTLGYFLQNQGQYNLPWLYTIIEILKRVKQLTKHIDIYVSPFAHKPSPLKIPSNCLKCSSPYEDFILNKYNYFQDVAVFDDIHCDCVEQWKEELKKSDNRTIENRLLEILS